MERSITRKRTLFNVLLIGLIFLAFCAGGAFSQRKSGPKPTPTPRDLIRKSADVYPERSRVALVIGNSAYQVGRLKNPVNDANAMTTTLRGVGFDVVSRTDATLSSMRQAIGEFSRKVQSEGVRLFYFAGHGVQANGKNYLIPVDAKIERLSDLSLQAIDLDTIMLQLETDSDAKKIVNIIILDSCRNNPFITTGRNVAQGMAQTDASAGTFIAYATAPGKTASDGTGVNGLYTQELIRLIKEPGLTIEEVFKGVRTQVREKSGGTQIPWDSSSLEGTFAFLPGKPQNTVQTQNQPTVIQTPGSQNQTSIQPASRSTVGYDIIEANYRSNLLDDVIRDSRIFLQSEPNHPKVNAIYGQSLFTQGKVAEAIPYLENAVVLGQAVTFRAFRGKILLNSESLDNVFIEVSDKAFAFQSKDESFVAEFSKLSEVAFVSNQSGMAYISVRGEFLYTEAKNKKQKTEKNKQIFLVAPMAGITKAAGGANILTGGATTINRIACSNCEVWTKEVVRFLNRCRTGEIKLNAVETVTSMRSGPLNNSKTVERPSAEFYPYVSERAFQMAIPRNWKAMPNGDMIFATDGARDGTAITHGAMVIFSNALYDRLPDAVRAVSQDILSGNTYLRLTGSTNAKLSGRDATVVSLEGRSPTTGKVEVAYLYIALMKDKRAVTFVFVCPDEERSVYQDTFNRMVASIRFKD